MYTEAAVKHGTDLPGTEIFVLHVELVSVPKFSPKNSASQRFTDKLYFTLWIDLIETTNLLLQYKQGMRSLFLCVVEH